MHGPAIRGEGRAIDMRGQPPAAIHTECACGSNCRWKCLCCDAGQVRFCKRLSDVGFEMQCFASNLNGSYGTTFARTVEVDAGQPRIRGAGQMTMGFHPLSRATHPERLQRKAARVPGCDELSPGELLVRHERSMSREIVAVHHLARRGVAAEIGDQEIVTRLGIATRARESET